MLALFVALAILHTWPLATAPGTLSRNDNGDFILHEWIMAWVSHQVVTNPLHLFDANIFYPERYTLAYSDHLFVQSMLGAPLLWAGASPVLVHNLVLIAGFALTGWATCSGDETVDRQLVGRDRQRHARRLQRVHADAIAADSGSASRVFSAGAVCA